MSHPFHEGVAGCWPEAGLLAPGPTAPRLPGLLSSASGCVGSADACGQLSPVTVAGPRRSHTGLPFTTDQ